MSNKIRVNFRGVPTRAEIIERFGLKRLDQVEREQIDWIWYPYLARGEVTIWEGDPDVGKSYSLQAAMKALCDGESLPSPRAINHHNVRVLYCDMENKTATVTKNRMQWMGMTRQDRFHQAEKPFNLNDGELTNSFLSLCDLTRPDIVVFDTTSHYMGKVEASNASNTMLALEVFVRVAREHNCAVVLVRHLTKSTRDKAIYRGQGSISFIGTARITVSVGYVPDSDDERALVMPKFNIGRKPQALTFTITDDSSAGDPDRSRFEWGKYIEVDAETIVNSKPEKSPDREMAKNLLREMLASSEVEKRSLERAADARGFSVRTLYNAAKELGVNMRTEGFGKNKKSFWSLPIVHADADLQD